MEEMSVAEAIQYLKAEILAQDWRLSPRRIEACSRAFGTIERELGDREAVMMVLGMARAALDYIRKHGNGAMADVFDFQKESLAHLVSMVEDPDLSDEQAGEISARAYRRFESLKRKIAARRAAG